MVVGNVVRGDASRDRSRLGLIGKTNTVVGWAEPNDAALKASKLKNRNRAR